MCELGACLCNIPNITNKNSYEQQIDQGNKIGLKLKKKKKNVSVKYEMRVALYGCGPRILRYCNSAMEGRVKERKKARISDATV